MSFSCLGFCNESSRLLEWLLLIMQSFYCREERFRVEMRKIICLFCVYQTYILYQLNTYSTTIGIEVNTVVLGGRNNGCQRGMMNCGWFYEVLWPIELVLTDTFFCGRG